jgi:hypothetical protein
MAGPGLLVNIDATYPDTGDASVRLHQLDHDKGHATLNAIDVLGTSDGATQVSTLPSTPVLLAGVVANSQVGTAYTLVSTDAGKVIECNNASPVTLTVPPNSSVAFPIGTVVEVWGQGLGAVTVAQGAGVTIRSPSTLVLRAQYSSVTVRKRATNEWVLAGDTT